MLRSYLCRAVFLTDLREISVPKIGLVYLNLGSKFDTISITNSNTEQSVYSFFIGPGLKKSGLTVLNFALIRLNTHITIRQGTR